MSPVDQVLQRVEARRQVGVLGSRLGRSEVVGVAAAADLYEQRIHVCLAGPADELVDLLGRFEAVVEGVNPDRAHLRRIERHGLQRRGGGRRDVCRRGRGRGGDGGRGRAPGGGGGGGGG